VRPLPPEAGLGVAPAQWATPADPKQPAIGSKAQITDSASVDPSGPDAPECETDHPGGRRPAPGEFGQVTQTPRYAPAVSADRQTTMIHEPYPGWNSSNIAACSADTRSSGLLARG
jgi:hypothetical protein